MSIVQAIAYLFSKLGTPNEDVEDLRMRVEALEAKVLAIEGNIGDMSEMPTIE